MTRDELIEELLAHKKKNPDDVEVRTIVKDWAIGEIERLLFVELRHDGDVLYLEGRVLR